MLKHIEYALEFSNGQKRSLTTDLQPGSTMITGRNGRGKSLLLEMFSFALFGVKALRGIATDYKKIDVTVRVNIRGRDYEIKRTKTKAQIGYPGDAEPLATTTSPVNQFIEQLLGYNYDVFRISNWCAQGDIQALASMKPTERKAMIDNVAGLTQLDGLIEIVNNDIKTFKASVNAVEQAISKPIAPLAPETNEETINAKLERARELQAKGHELGSAINEYRFLKAPAEVAILVLRHKPTTPPANHPYPAEPTLDVVEPFTLQAPVKPSVMGDNSYEDMVTRCRNIWDDLTSKQNTVARLEQAWRKLPDVPDHLIQVVLNTDRQHWEQQAELWNQKQAYEALLAQGDVTCPNCKVRHPVASDALANFDVTLFPEQKPLAVADYDRYKQKLNAQAELEAAAKLLVDTFGDKQAQQQAFDRLDQIKAELVSWKKAVDEYTNAQALHKVKLDNLEKVNAQKLENWKTQCKMIDQRNAEQLRAFEQHCLDIEKDNARELAKHEQEKAAFAVAQAEYEANVKVRDQLQAELAELVALPEYQEASGTIAQCAVELTNWNTYRALHQQYLKHLESYDQAMARVANEKAQLEDLAKAKVALVELKARVKTYIIPSLNKVASFLLSEMTGGEHSSITIDDDFEVYVDNQPLRTMSGSGKDIANLSIRIALGRILTHKVLGMVMLDEIDQGMDDSRAAFTWECIEKITPQIGQVLQVSHKELRAENRLVIQ